jgi:hypothetical protein
MTELEFIDEVVTIWQAAGEPDQWLRMRVEAAYRSYAQQFKWSLAYKTKELERFRGRLKEQEGELLEQMQAAGIAPDRAAALVRLVHEIISDDLAASA